MPLTSKESNPPCPILRIGLTGGIASGKSYVCKQLEAAGFPTFYCDDEAKRIIRHDPAVRNGLTALIGPRLYAADGTLVKRELAAWLCRGKDFSHRVDRIVHPRVAEAFRRRAAQQAAALTNKEIAEGISLPRRNTHDRQGAIEVTLDTLLRLPTARVLIMECALLFESGFDRLVDRTLLIHVSPATQLARLMARDHLTPEGAQAWIDLQLSEAERMKRADYFIVNE